MGKHYTKGTASIWPSGHDDMSSELSASEISALSADDNSYVFQGCATGEKIIFLFREILVAGTTAMERNWKGKSSVSTTEAMVYLQVYNFNDSLWETVDANAVEDADTEFTLSADITDTTNYIDAYNTVYFRVVQSEAKNTNVWTLAVIPDTQKLVRERTAHCKTHWESLLQYIVDNETSKNIQMTLHLGDVCDQINATVEWERASDGINIALNNDLPILWSTGNHDYDGNPDSSTSRAQTLKEARIPYSTYSNYSWFGATTYPTNSMRNTYAVKTISGEKWMFINFEFYPRVESLEWAESAITAESPDFIVVSTHGYLNYDGNLIGWNSLYGPSSYSLCRSEGSDVSCSGEKLWTDFISLHEEIVLVFSGHVYIPESSSEWLAQGGTNGDGTAHAIKQTTHPNGNICNQIVCNFQQSYCFKENWVLGKSYGLWTGANSPVLDETTVACSRPGEFTYYYVSKQAHTSTAETEPEVGASWTNYWTRASWNGCGMAATACFYEIDPDRRTVTRYDYNPVMGISPQNYPEDNYPAQVPDWHSKHSFTFKY